VGIFPNVASADRLMGAHLLERHESWVCERARCLTMNWVDERKAKRQKQKKKVTNQYQYSFPPLGGRGKLKNNPRSKT
jgi:hypothetical protein